jgi:NADH-quinone oxidoreductase subunit A
VGHYLPIVGLLVLSVIFAAGSFITARVLAPRHTTRPKRQAYESGIVPGRQPPERFPVRFYLVAMVFIVFDIEIIFLYPFAIVHEEIGLFGLIAIAIFAASVFESFLYLLSKGAIDWGPIKQLHRQVRAEMVSGERTARTTVRRVGTGPDADYTPTRPKVGAGSR